MPRYGALVVGGGHNGSVCAAYLAGKLRGPGYRTPVAGLYVCGSGTHPGGGITGAPGRTAARAILGDRRRLG